MNKRIAILIPYFGKWPDWIDLYFYSCAHNTGIDWFFFTDCKIPEYKSANLHFQSYAFLDYCKYVSDRLGIDFKPQNPYKLCALKPFYGFLHSELIKEFDFWGFGDVDVVWGDILSFYTPDLLDKYDVFSTHADRLSGHLSLFLNTHYYTHLCFKIKDWQPKLKSDQMIALDEQEFTWLLYPQVRYISKCYSKVIRKIFNWRDAWVLYYKITPIFNFVCRIKSKRLYFKEQHTTPILYPDGLSFRHDSETWFYKNGKVINKKNSAEYIYLHFMIYKKNGFRKDYCWEQNYYRLAETYDFSNGVYISKSGFEAL